MHLLRLLQVYDVSCFNLEGSTEPPLPPLDPPQPTRSILTQLPFMFAFEKTTEQVEIVWFIIIKPFYQKQLHSKYTINGCVIHCYTNLALFQEVCKK